MPLSPPPPSWELLARNHIPGRDWKFVSNIWAAAALGFELASISELSQDIEPIVGPGFERRATVSVFEFPDGHVAAFHDAAVALSKCAYVLRTVGNCLLGGQPTWASVDAYHFSLLGCKTLLAFLGVHFVHVRDTRCVLDVFPQGDLEQTKRRFRNDNPGAQNPARLIYRAQGALIEQRAMWAILLRILYVTKLPAKLDKDIDAIRQLGAGFGRSRNDMLYGNSHWLYEEDFRRPSNSIAIQDDIYAYSNLEDFFSDQRDANFAFAAVLVRILLALIADIEARSGISLLQTSYGPCLGKFDGFDFTKLNALFATMYRKEGYGIDI
jgi:hypothetical protein